MGDCILRIRLSDALRQHLASHDTSNAASDAVQPQLQVRLASDATVGHVLATSLGVDAVAPTLQSLWQSRIIQVWDCSDYPPKNIQTTLQQFPETSGPRSLTLFDAGWFPSGTLGVTLSHEQTPPTRVVNYDDVQYSAPAIQDEPSLSNHQHKPAAVQLQHTPPSTNSNGGPLLPSQVLQSVAARFDGIDAVPTTMQDEATARQLRHQSAAQAAERQRQRQAKLQARIERLDQQQNGVANQVQKMLIKSRATGRHNLAQADRVYLRVVVDDDDDGSNAQDDTTKDTCKEDFVFVSRQDVVGKVLSQRTTPSGYVAELLVRQLVGEQADAYAYRRIPNLMRFYQAIQAGCLQDFDRVVIRCYDPTKDDPTPAVSTEPVSEPTVVETASSNTIPAAQEDAETPDTSNAVADSQGTDDCIMDEALATALASMDKSKKGKAAKSSATAVKVRQMQIKSKAQGDAKRVKMPLRFFVEVVTARREADGVVSIVAPAAPYFLALADPLQRLLRDGFLPKDVPGTAQFWKPTLDATKFQRITNPSTSVQELCKDGVVQSFDRIILYYW